MPTLNFPSLIYLNEDVNELLTNEKTKHFDRLCIQFYWEEPDIFTLVAHPVKKSRKHIDTKLIFLKRNSDKLKGAITLQIDYPVILGQFELSNKEIKELSNNGVNDLIFKPSDKYKINPVAVSYDVNGLQLNPCPPADPPSS